jgi:hypothetical protein
MRYIQTKGNEFCWRVGEGDEGGRNGTSFGCNILTGSFHLLAVYTPVICGNTSIFFHNRPPYLGLIPIIMFSREIIVRMRDKANMISRGKTSLRQLVEVT